MPHLRSRCLTVAFIASSPAALFAQDSNPSSLQRDRRDFVAVDVRYADDFTADQIDRYIRGVSAAKALRERTVTEEKVKEAKERSAGMEAGMRVASLPQAQLDKILAHMECRQSAFQSPGVSDLFVKEANTKLHAAERKAAGASLAALYAKRCGAPPKGFELMNPPVAETETEEEPDYEATAVEASGLGERDFARMNEIVTAYVLSLENGTAVKELNKMFTPAELAVLKLRIAKLRTAYAAAKELRL